MQATATIEAVSRSALEGASTGLETDKSEVDFFDNVTALNFVGTSVQGSLTAN